MKPSGLVLRDVHDVPAPALWPLAWGWWLVIGGLLLLAGIVCVLVWRRRFHRQRAARLFDAALAAHPDPAGRLRVMSELLRRAAIQRRPDAAVLHGEEWIAHLSEGMPPGSFEGATGRLLAHGLYLPEVADAEVDALVPIARHRFVEWMVRK